ncbi:hypothetical protein KAR91_75050 [Candidatus Pacearchaeota archaeon]|nr:hypothetical protein [Candidatus Pacearchaeota archaeon]
MTTINGVRVKPNTKCFTCKHYDKGNHLSFPLRVCMDCIHYAVRMDNYAIGSYSFRNDEKGQKAKSDKNA